MLATQLATDPTRRVRVFIEDPAKLSPLSARIDNSLWVQPLATCEIWRSRLAEVVAPADNILCMDGYEIPTKYRERIAYGADAQPRRVLRIWSLGHSPEEPSASKPPDLPSSLSFDVLQDEAPNSTGLIKAHRSTAGMRARWKAQSDLTQATLEGMGFRGALSRGTLIFLCWNVNLPSPVQLCRMLERVCGKPVLLVAVSSNGSQSQAISCAGENLACQSMRSPSWTQIDELVWGSDLVFCHQRDVAHRAMEAGTPMLWLREEDGLFNWYFDGLDLGFKRSLAAVAHHFRNAGAPSSELMWLLNQREALEAIAKNVAQRFAQAVLLTDSLPSIGPLLAEQAKLRQRTSHQATTPMSLPGE
jgi:hypothetical protein